MCSCHLGSLPLPLNDSNTVQIQYKSCWTPCALEMHCIALRISLMSPGAVHFSAATNIYPHAAQALFRPAQNWVGLSCIGSVL